MYLDYFSNGRKNIGLIKVIKYYVNCLSGRFIEFCSGI